MKIEIDGRLIKRLKDCIKAGEDRGWWDTTPLKEVIEQLIEAEVVDIEGELEV